MKKKIDNNCQLILQNIAEGVVVISLDRKIIFINETAKKLIGLPDNIPEGALCNEVMNTDLCTNSCPFNTIVNTSCASHFINIHLRKPDSIPVPLCLNVSPLKDTQGRNIGVIENFRPMRDIVEIIDSLEKNNVLLSQEKSRIDSIVNSLADGVFTTDAELRITSFNKGLEHLTGLKTEDIIGLKCGEVLQADNCEKDCPLSYTLRNGYGMANCKERIVGKDGTTIPVCLSTAILKDQAGRNIGLVATIKDLTETERLRKELNERYRLSNIIGGSRQMQEIFESIEAVSDTDCVVLIQGESGTGKELIARAIHHQSLRRDKPFVKVNCAAIVEGLFESELFGHVKGAFTGAIRDKLGKFELANGGTIFLDEIGDMPVASQPKLLRILQDGEFERVGDVKTKKVDVRVIAATNVDLREAIRTKKFREDLFYRLCVVPVNLGDITWYGALATGKLDKLGPGTLNLFASAAINDTDPGKDMFTFAVDGNGDGDIADVGTFDNPGTGAGLLYDDDPMTPGSDEESHTGSSVYVGARYDIESTGTKIGAEYNHGSKFWIGMVPAGDDIWTSKLGTRGDVYEVYLIQELKKVPVAKRGKVFFRLGYQYYKFKYTGSNSWVGEPKKISDLSASAADFAAGKAQMFMPLEKAQDIYATMDVLF